MPVVAAIWGYAIYVYLFADHEQEHAAPVTTISVSEELPAQPMEVDTFSLLANYPDPFLTSFSRPTQFHPRQSTPPSAIQPVPKNTPKKEPIATLPATGMSRFTFHYNGLIQHHGTDKLVGILRIDDKTHFVNVGSEVKGITVTKMTPDSISLRADKEYLTIGRK